MKCVSCGTTRDVVDVMGYNRPYCPDCFVKSVEKKVRKTIRVNRLIGKTEKIAVALSGGKDSMALLYLLSKITKKNPNIELIAISVDEGIAGYRSSFLKGAKDLCKDLKIRHYIYSFKSEFGIGLDEIVEKTKKPACSYCGVIRRYILNTKARELKATKLATGHNLDDEVQSGLMNFLRGDYPRMARMGPLVGIVSNKLFVPRIKPLRNIPEKEIAYYAFVNDLQVGFQDCPYAADALRDTVREVVDELDRRHKGTLYQTLQSIDRLVPILKEYYGDVGKPEICKTCSEITSGESCMVCEIRKELKLE